MTVTNDHGLGPTVFEARMSGRARLLICVALVVVAAVPRIVDLGHLSFYGDEETSAFPARSLARGEAAQVPSGMAYRRALPLTWLNAVSADAFGLSDESSYRLSSAALGALSPAALFLLAHATAGPTVAVVAATAMVTSEWHLAFSRTNRMYVPFLLFFMIAAFFGWRWISDGRDRDGGWFLATSAVALSLHQIGLSLILLPLFGLVTQTDRERPTSGKLIGSAVLITAVALAHDHLFISPPYEQMRAPEIQPSGTLLSFDRLLEGPLGSALPWLVGSAALGAGLGIWTAARFASVGEEVGSWPARLANYGLLAAAGALAGTGQVYGLALFLALHAVLLVHSPRETWTAVSVPLVSMLGLGLGVAGVGVVELGLAEGLRTASRFPFPYAYFMVEQSWGLSALLVASIPLIVLWRSGRRSGLRTCAAFVLVVLAGLGSISAWGPTRYYWPLYPFWLILASTSLVTMIAWTLRSLESSVSGLTLGSIGVVVILTGMSGGHGIPQTLRVVTLEHGTPIEPALHGVPFRPDHRTPGRRLGELATESDVVVAEDPLQVAWYAGRADVWLRSYRDSRSFLGRGADGSLRDIYVGSRLIMARDSLDELVRNASGRVWLVTSGETARSREYYLEDDQRRWLDSLEAVLEPTVRGEDDATNLYCLNCRSPGSTTSGADERARGDPREARDRPESTGSQGGDSG